MIQLYKGDCLEEMKKIETGSVDMVLTDPPYGTTACKWDSVIPFEPMWEQLNRVIKPNGAIVLFGSVAKGEDSIESDIDIVIIGKEKHIDLNKFEDKIDKEITIHCFSWNEWNKMANKKDPFYYEVINSGIPLYKELPIVQI